MPTRRTSRATQALEQLTHLVESLRQDQHDPRLSAQGLLGNFLDLATGKRLGPLASDVEKQKFLDAFGPREGRGDLEGPPGQGLDRPAQPGPRGRHPARSPTYGWDHFDGPLAPYRRRAPRSRRSWTSSTSAW